MLSRILPQVPECPALPPTFKKLFPQTAQLVADVFAAYRRNIYQAGFVGAATGLGVGLAAGIVVGVVLGARLR